MNKQRAAYVKKRKRRLLAFNWDNYLRSMMKSTTITQHTEDEIRTTLGLPPHR